MGMTEEQIKDHITVRARVLADHPINETIKEEIASLSLFFEACYAMAAESKAVEPVEGGSFTDERDRQMLLAVKLFDALMGSIRQQVNPQGSGLQLPPEMLRLLQ